MSSSVFQIPRKFVFGIDSINRLGEEARELSEYREVRGNRVVVITDKGVKGAGLVDKAKKPLESAGFAVQVFPEARPEPDYESYNRVIEEVRREQYDFVVGVGGGSAMDQAKLAAMMATHEGSFTKYIALPPPQQLRFERCGLPMILIPTTAGTGSEITPYSVLIGEHGIKEAVKDERYMLADLALVDPMMTVSLPPEITASSGMDALSHAMHGFLTHGPVSPLSESLIHRAISLIATNLRVAYVNGENAKARSNMSLAASMGFMGTISIRGGTGGINHDLGEVFGPLYNMPHGSACGLSTIYDLKFNVTACPEKLATLANLFGEDTDGLPLSRAATNGVEVVRRLAEDVGLPVSLRDISVPKSDLPRLAKLSYERIVMKNRAGWIKRNPRKITLEGLMILYEDMWEGDTSSDRS